MIKEIQSFHNCLYGLDAFPFHVGDIERVRINVNLQKRYGGERTCKWEAREESPAISRDSS